MILNSLEKYQKGKMIDKYLIEVTIQMLEDELNDPSTDCKITMYRIRECIGLLHCLKRKA